MAKSKWEKFSLAISLLLNGIERYIQDVDRTVSKYNLFSFCFQANSTCSSQSDFDYSKYVCMANTYRIFFGIFSLNLNLKKELEKPFLAYPQVYQPLERSQTQKAIRRTWSVKIQPAEKIIQKLINLPLELLLYCPSASEYEECSKWFGKENRTLFLFDIMHSLSIEAAQEAKILNNLAQPIEKHFSTFIGSKTASKTCGKSFSFKASSEESLKTALEKAIMCRSNRKIGHAYDLFKDWEELLQALTFKGTDWSTEARNACLLRMKRHVKYIILIGKGKGLRARRLFPDINKRNLKNILKSAFQTIFPDHPSDFSLDSLLIFPHQFVGSILPASLLKNKRNPDALAGKIGDLKGCLLKGYKPQSSH